MVNTTSISYFTKKIQDLMYYTNGLPSAEIEVELKKIIDTVVKTILIISRLILRQSRGHSYRMLTL